MTRAPPEASEARGGAEVGLTGRGLVSPAGLLVERPGQALEVCVEGDEARALEEGAPARLVGDAVERALAEAGGDLAAAGQAHGRRVEGVDGDLALPGLPHGALEVNRVNNVGVVEAARGVQAVGDEEHGVAV